MSKPFSAESRDLSSWERSPGSSVQLLADPHRVTSPEFLGQLQARSLPLHTTFPVSPTTSLSGPFGIYLLGFQKACPALKTPFRVCPRKKPNLTLHHRPSRKTRLQISTIDKINGEKIINTITAQFAYLKKWKIKPHPCSHPHAKPQK